MIQSIDNRHTCYQLTSDYVDASPTEGLLLYFTWWGFHYSHKRKIRLATQMSL